MTKRLAAVAALACLPALAAGLWLGGHPEQLPSPLRDVFVDDQAALSAEASSVIEDTYYKRVGPALLEDGSTAGMIKALRKRFKDRFSHYFDPKTYKRFSELTSGVFSGVGMSVTQIKRGLRVTDVFPGTPAKAAGIKKGDLIVAVNGKSIAGQDSRVSTALIKGAPGTTVKLTVVGRSNGEKRELTVKRARVEIPAVRGSLEQAGGQPVAYVRLSNFSRVAHGALRQKFDQLYERGAEGFVLDLRGNGGGLLVEAVLTASTFVPKGKVVVKTSGRKQPTNVYRAVGGALKPKPAVVLIDHDSASAAEILTAALAEHGLATVVGTQSFGKGVFQQVIPLENGGALDLTVGEYFTPDGKSLAGKGIEPEIPASDDPDTKPDEGLQRALAVLGQEL